MLDYSRILAICDPLPGLVLAVFSVYLNSEGYSEHRGGVLFSLVETHKSLLALTSFFFCCDTLVAVVYSSFDSFFMAEWWGRGFENAIFF